MSATKADDPKGDDTTPRGDDGLPLDPEKRKAAVAAQFDDFKAQIAALDVDTNPDTRKGGA